MLGAIQVGRDDHQTLALVHGFTQTGSSWSQITNAFSEQRRCLQIDAPGHGSSALISANLWQTADQLVALAGEGIYCGYSMGARMVLHAALAHPRQVKGLILISASPGISDATERLERRFQDDQLAERIRLVGTEIFIDEWLARPMFAHLPRDLRQVAERKSNSAQGLASSLELCGVGTQDDLWPRLSELRMPVLIVAGSLDEKFVKIATDMQAMIEGSDLQIVKDSGHSVHLERPKEFLAITSQWLASR